MSNNKCRTEIYDVNRTSGNPKYSSNNVLYQGKSDEEIGICTNSILTSVIQVLITDIKKLNSDLNVDNYEICEAIRKEIGSDTTFKNLFRSIINSRCSIEEIKTDIQNILGDTKRIVLNLRCLRDRVTNDNCEQYTPLVLRTILQLLVDSICDLKTEFDLLKSDIDSYIVDRINVAISSLNIIEDPIPVGAIIPYVGNMAYFDSTGKGSGPMVRYAIANGANGTTDYRGFVIVGSQNNMGTNPQDPLVTNTNYSIGSKGGKVYYNLSSSQLPPHTHTINTSNVNFNIILPTTNSNTVPPTYGPGLSESFLVNNFQTNNILERVSTISIDLSDKITIDSSGLGDDIDNRMPYKSAVFIQRII